MTKSAWQDALFPLIAKAARIDPVAFGNHPAYRGLCRRIDQLIAVGLEHEYITPEGAALA